MINRIISFSIKNKLIIGLFTLALIGLGIYSMQTINLGAKPDISTNQVQIITVAQNLATEDIEQFVTYPVELAMGNLPGVKEIRSVSRFGLSVVTIVFKEEMGMFLPRQLVQEKLNEVEQEIPNNFGHPQLGPITTGLGEIYQYTIDAKPGYEDAYSLTKLRTIQDWIVKRQLTMIKGVVEVNSFGGAIKQYEIAINPEQLNAMNVSISDIFTALKKNNANTGGTYIVKNHMANFIRGEGLIQSLDDIRNIVIKNINGYPLLIKDVATDVHFGKQVRYGAFTKDGHEAVGGMILMLKGANPNKVIHDVKKRIDQIQQSLPEGLIIQPFLDRSKLIARTTDTVTKNLTEGALIVVFVLVILLGSLRGGLITASLIPLSLLFAFILMKWFGVSANLMSLGAIDFGIIVDGAVIIVEGTVYGIDKHIQKQNQLKLNQETMDKLTLKASSTMMNSAFFGQLIILIVFTPLLFLTGIEGKMFQPMAFTFGFALLGAIILCLTYVPVVSSLVLRPITNKKNLLGRIENAFDNFSKWLLKGLTTSYHSLLEKVLRIKWFVLLLAVILLGWAGFTFSRMGGEFIPQLDEGDIAMQALLRPGSALSETIEVSKKIEDSLLANFPEIETVTARIGVADIPTDPMPMDIADLFIILNKNQEEWTSAKTKKELIKKIKKELEFLVGVNLVFSQPIEMRFNELLTGVQEDVAVKLYGPDLEVLARKGQEMVGIIKEVQGVGDANAERISGLPQIVIRYDRQKIAQYGLTIHKLNKYLNIAFAGGVAGIAFEKEKRFNIVVRLDSTHRKNIADVRNLYIDLPNHTQIPLKEVASITYIPGPMQISRENTFRRTYVGVNVSGRDVESVVQDIQKRLTVQLDLPPGYHISYGGTFENLQRAQDRLSIVVPIALILIFILLYFALKSLKEACIIYAAVPLATIGGIFFLHLRGMPFSISAGVGFIVLFGVAVLNGLVLISRFNTLKAEGVHLRERLFIGTEERLRPILLTAIAAIMGFVPMAFSTSAGAEVQRPLATVVIGGLISATLLTLLVIPILYALIEKKKPMKKEIKAGLITLFILVGSTLIPSPGYSQSSDSLLHQLPQLTKEKAIQLALENYPKLKSKALEIKEEKVAKKTAWDFGTTEVFTGMEEFNRSAKGVYTPIGIQQREIDIFGIGSKLKLQKQKIKWAELALQLSKIEIKKKVSQSWNKVFITQKIYSTYQKMDSIFSKIENNSKVKYQTGDISQLEYLSTTNQAQKIHLKKQQTLSNYKIAIYKYNLWLVSDTLFGIVLPKDVAILHQLPDVEDIPKTHPKIQIAQQSIKVADAKIREVKSNYWPSLSGEYGMQRVDGKSGFHSFQVGIQIPLLFNQLSGRTQIAKIKRKEAALHYQVIKIHYDNAYKENKMEYLKWRNSWYYYQKKAIPLAQKQQSSALISYRAGAINYTSFLQSINNAIQIQLDAWNTLEKLLIKQTELKYLLP